MSKFPMIILACLLPMTAQAEVYRWTDEEGRVHYSDAVPPEPARSSLVGADARGGFVSSAPLSYHSTSVRMVTPTSAASIAAPATRGLDFRNYVSLHEGMSEGELLGIAGEPDLLRRDHFVDLYTYMPTSGDPFTTTIKLVRGRVTEIDRQRKF
jgi:hypothetical protein